MATLDTTGVVATMFQDDVVLTKGGNTYSLPANTVIGIPDDTASVTTDISTTALCMTQKPRTYGTGLSALNVVFFNEIRVVN